MITVVDTNVILDVLNDDPRFASTSIRAMREALGDGALMACDVVWAEVGAWYAQPEDTAYVRDRFGIRFATLDPEVAAAAGACGSAIDPSRGGGASGCFPTS